MEGANPDGACGEKERVPSKGQKISHTVLSYRVANARKAETARETKSRWGHWEQEDSGAAGLKIGALP